MQKGLLAGQGLSPAPAAGCVSRPAWRFWKKKKCFNFPVVNMIQLKYMLLLFEITGPKMFAPKLSHLSHSPWFCKFISFAGVWRTLWPETRFRNSKTNEATLKSGCPSPLETKGKHVENNVFQIETANSNCYFVSVEWGLGRCSRISVYKNYKNIWS